MKALPEWYHYFAGAADKIQGETIPSDKTNFFVYTRREPIGVVGAIVPWNSPVLLLTWKLAPALAAGCTIVAKPAEQTPASVLEFAGLFEEAGFPPGVFNVVTGNGPTTGRALVRHPGVDKVAFTGSTETGISVMKDAADHLAKVSLELGGKSPQIVFDDADLEASNNGVVAGVFAATGQTCMAGSRLFVQRKAHDELVVRLSERANSIKLGDPFGAETEMGPVAFEEHLEKVQSYVGSAGRRAPSWSAVASVRNRPSSGMATLLSPPSSPGSTTACGSRAKRSSVRCSRSSPSRTNGSSSGRPTARASG
jgi:aldehyde dehydrogenase (NAD+)